MSNTELVILLGLAISIGWIGIRVWEIEKEIAVKKASQDLDSKIEKVVSGKIDFLMSDTLEPGVYMPKKEPVTGSMGYEKVSEQQAIDRWLATAVHDEDNVIQDLLGVNNGQS